MKVSRTRWTSALVATSLIVAACNGEKSSNGSTSQTPEQRDSTLTHQNALLTAQKDSLFGATRSLIAAIASIDSATTLAGVKPSKHKGEPITSYEEQVRVRTVEALDKLRKTQAQLNTTLARVSKLKGQNAEAQAQIDTFRLTITALQRQIASQTARGDSLVRALGVAIARGDTLQYKNAVLGTSLDSAARESRIVWYIAGPKDYLMKHSIVAEVGGTRFPFVVKRGSTLRPANLHPDTTLFHPFDMIISRTIPLEPGKSYEVISSQDLNGADRSNAKGRVFTGSINITDPQLFWAPSHYLILRQL
jgi:hypothetical protein